MATKTSPSATQIKVKKEISSEEIKEFAETAMNELLGWYGYDKVDRMEMAKDNRLPTSAALTTTVLATLQKQREPIEDKNSNGIAATTESSLSDKDSSREDSRSPISLKIADVKDNDCSWCRRQIPANCNEILGSPDGPVFCSESCFAQSRRAVFKRAKLCDWCRHIRHAVSYVDFQDGASQLQFCSDKCLNQYKMQIFCKETQAHLDMNPHLKEKGNDNSGASLITPDLWLKNCKSRSASPVSECSRSISPAATAIVGSSSSVSSLNVMVNTPTQQDVKKPMITVAPPSKLFTKNVQHIQTRQNLRLSKRRKHSRLHHSSMSSTSAISSQQPKGNDSGNNNNNNSSGACISSGNALHNNNNNLTVNHNLYGLGLNKNCTVTSGQDIRNNSNSSTTQQAPVVDPNTLTFRENYQHQFLPPPPNLFPIRPQFMPRSPRMHAPNAQFRQFPHHFEFPRMPTISGGSGGIPPVTILIPYPVILPLPIPVPIPIPMSELAKFIQKNAESNVDKPPDLPDINGAHREMPKSKPSTSNPSPKFSAAEAPLDYTKSKEKSENAITTQEITISEANTEKNESLEQSRPSTASDDDSIIATTSKLDSTVLKEGGGENELKLPKFKITRLNSKRILTKEYESSRPLRKRKRIIVDNE